MWPPPPNYLLSLTVVLGERLPCFAVTYLPLIAERNLPEPEPLLFLAMTPPFIWYLATAWKSLGVEIGASPFRLLSRTR